MTAPKAPRFAALAKRARKACNETQDQFAARLGIHPMTVSKWERGVSDPGKLTRRQLRAFIAEARK